MNEFSPIGLEQFGAMMINEQGELVMTGMDTMSGAIHNQILPLILLMGTAVTISM